MIIENAAICTVDSAGTEYANGYVVLDGEWVTAVGAGPAPWTGAPRERVDGSGCLVTPGLINTHHHLYQWATRGHAVDAGLFDWLTALYPVWNRFDAEITHAAASAGLARLALTGTSTVADHHYVFPHGGGDQVGAVLAAAERIGTRCHLVRGSMDRGVREGGLPPDDLVEDTEEALSGTEAAIEVHHDPAPNARVRIAVGPCSPFSVTERLMRGAAELARRKEVRLHTHLAETAEEDRRCRAELGVTPAQYAERLGWLGADVWLAHTVHPDPEAVGLFGTTGTGSAHCPSSNGRLGSGIAPVRALLDAGVPVGLGVDGAASNESGGLAEEMRAALLQARQRDGPGALTVREALRMATMGGARCLGRERELGSIEAGKLADIAVWRLDGFEHAGIADPVAAFVLGAPAPVELLLVGGKPVVSQGEPCGCAPRELAAELRSATGRLA
ncbi:8-oxoguanine deaminase [Sciscionella marina]|uniref:8-oxoguanine deaminase n=1 Tax=Sciscionella marina TaxID=508770 RepID=UPI000374ADA1|nr:8-oxoguanine deaminase [Sciscionella marina]